VVKHFITDVSKPTKTGKIRIKKWFFMGDPYQYVRSRLAFPFLDRFFINLYLPDEHWAFMPVYRAAHPDIFHYYFPLTLALHPRIMNLWNESKKQEAIQTIKWGVGIMIGFVTILLFIMWMFENVIFDIIHLAIPQMSNQHKTLIIPLLSAGFLWQFHFSPTKC
jgi:hypothetical protein